jgi:sugar/nucleoside kinase (ribokinase family)
MWLLLYGKRPSASEILRAVRHRGESIASEPLAVEAWDPIGAGDYFGAAFAYGLLQGWSLQKVSDFANAFAALCISRKKGEGLPSLAETLASLER